MSTFAEMFKAAALPGIQGTHGFNVTFTQASTAATQTVTAYDSLGEQLGAVDVKSERNLICEESDFTSWTPNEGDYMTPSDDSDKYTILKSALRTNGTRRLQGWKPEAVT